METLHDYISRKFGISDQQFLEIFRISPGAEGYLLGSIGEQLFKEYAESIGYEVLRIKEKPDGGYRAKKDDARGDFYIRKKGAKKDEWFVVECKGVKTNAEKRAGLTNKNSCKRLLREHSVDRIFKLSRMFISGKKAYLRRLEKWEHHNTNIQFPSFSWIEDNPGPGIPSLQGLFRNNKEICDWIDSFDDNLFSEKSYWDLRAPIRLVQTHMPSTRIDHIGIKSTGPLKEEFNILCVDLFLKTGQHEFVFANSQDLNHQAAAPNHLQQNYTIDILTARDNFARHELLSPWYNSLDTCITKSKPIPRKIDRSQLDFR